MNQEGLVFGAEVVPILYACHMSHVRSLIVIMLLSVSRQLATRTMQKYACMQLRNVMLLQDCRSLEHVLSGGTRGYFNVLLCRQSGA